MHACNIKFGIINVRGSRLIRENHAQTFIPSKYTRYNYGIHLIVISTNLLCHQHFPKTAHADCTLPDTGSATNHRQQFTQQ